MKICPNCQKSIPDNSAMCPYCLYTFEVKEPAPAPKPAPPKRKPVLRQEPAPKPEPAPASRPAAAAQPASQSGSAPASRSAAVTQPASQSGPAPALKPASQSGSVPAPKPEPAPKREYKPKLPSMSLGQEPMTEPESYSAYVKTAEKEKRKSMIKWVLIAVIIVIIAFVVHSALGNGSKKNDDTPVAAATPTPEDNEEKEDGTATPTPEAEIEEEVLQQEEFVIADSDSRYLTEEDLEKLTPEERRIARNEIYARHHRLFDDEELQNYFNGCSWYEGNISPSDFSEPYAASVFNEYELYNKDFILAYENEHK